MNKKILYGECEFGEPEKKLVLDVFEKKWLSNGYYTAEFEEKLAKWFGRKYCLTVNSGSVANFISLQALGLKPGSEVITMAMGFPTTVSPIIYHGLTPVFVDCHIPHYVINLHQAEIAISKKTKAIMFAHTLGNLCHMDWLMKIVKKNDLKLIEDTCDAVGSEWKGKKAGTFGDLATVSFYPSHHLTTFGEGGAILTDDLGLYRKCKSIREWGRACWCKWNEQNVNGACGHRFDNLPFDHKYYYINLGLNFKMTEAQAAFGVAQIDRLDGFIEKRKKNFKRLLKGLFRKVSSDFILPCWYEFADVSWFSFPITYLGDREKLIKYLEEKGIQTRTLFAGNITRHPAYKRTGRIIGDLKNSNIVLGHSFFVGIGPKLTNKEIDYIAETIKGFK